jgi:hypothetical protein
VPDRFTLDWVNGGTGRRPESPPDRQVERPWAVPAEAVAEALATDPAAGLTAEEVATTSPSGRATRSDRPTVAR